MFWKPVAGLMLVLLIGAAASIAPAQTLGVSSSNGDEMIYKYLCAQADQISGRFLDGAKTLEEWQKKRPRLRQEYLDMLGLRPLPEKTPLKATITGTLESQGVVIDKLHFQSKPGLYVTANLYRPKAPSANKLPAILYVCGHADRGRDGNKSAYQDHGMWFASNGYLCLILDSLQLGEIAGIHHGTYGIREKKPAEVRWWWHSAGYTPAGVECWNGVRAIDYLVSRDDVDQDKIGVTGISGGGAATFWIAAADERVKVAVPVSGMSDLQTYIKDKVINGHCDCMFLYNTYQWDWTTIAALVAPRPLLFANSDKDPIFPMDGNRRVMEKLRKIYTMYGKAELADEYISKGGHDYRQDLRIAAFRFLNKHLKNDTTSLVKDPQFKPIPGKELRVFPTDADTPKDALNAKIDETFVPRAKVTLPETGKFEEWKKTLLQQIRERSFWRFPQKIPPGNLGFSMVDGARSGDIAELAVFPGKRAEVSVQTTDIQGGVVWTIITTEPGIAVRLPHRWADKEDPGIINLLVDDSEGFERVGYPEWLKPLVNDRQVHCLFPRGRGTLSWTYKAPPNFVERSHALLGQTVDQGRILDIVSAVLFLTENDKGKRPCRVIGRGQAGILAAYAALFEPSIKEVIIIDPPKSHVEGPHFLGVLRVLDIPEALGLLAPTPLTLINAKDKAFDRTAKIYKLAGAAEKLTRK